MANIGINSMPTTYKAFANGYRELVEQSYSEENQIDHRDGIFRTEDTELAEDRIKEYGFRGEMRRRGDGDRANQGRIVEGYGSTTRQVEYSEEVPIGSLAKKFQPAGLDLTTTASMGLANDAYLLEQKAAFSLLAYGFSDLNNYLGSVKEIPSYSALAPDGQRVFSTQHPTFPGNSDTWSNVLADSPPLDIDSIDRAILNLNAQPDPDGQAKHYGANYGVFLLVPMNLKRRAFEITEAEYVPYSGDNEPNLINAPMNKTAGYGFSKSGHHVEVRVIPWLSEYSDLTTGNSAWFIIAKDAIKKEKPLRVLYTDHFYTDSYKDDARKTAYVRACVQFDPLLVSPRGMVASLGDGSTYTN